MANKQQIKFEADILGFKSAIKEAGSSITSLNKQLKLNQEQLKGNKDNVEGLQERVKLLKKEYEEQTTVVQNSISAYEQAVELFGENSEEAKKWSDKITEAETKQQKIKNALDETNKKLTEQSNTLITTGKSWTENGEKIEKVGNTIEKVGNKLSIASAGVATGLVATAKASIDYESAFTGVKKTVDATEEQLAELSDGILEMSTRMPAAATEIAGVAEAAGQLGIKTEDILSFTEVMINLGESTNLTADEAATSLAKFANITNMSSENYERLGSVIVDLGNNFATTEADIVNMATNLASTGELTGLTEPQIMALATAMSSVGIEAEAGGSAMSKLLKKIQVSCETGNASLEEFASVAGMSASEFKKAFEEDAVGALSSFLSGLNDTERNGKSAIAILQDMDLTEVRLSNTILSLSNANGVLSDAVDTANNAWDENTALQEEADKRYGTTESQIEMLKNEVTKLAIEFGDELAPSLRDLLEDVKPLLTKVADAIKKFSSLDDTTKQNTIKILALSTALGPAIKLFGSLTTGVGKAVTSIGKITTKVGELTSGVKIGNSSLSNYISSFSSFVGVGTALVAAGALWITTIETITNKYAEGVIEAQDYNNSIKEEIQTFEDLQTSKQKEMSSNLTLISNYQDLWNELKEITDENGKVKEGYENRAEYIVGELKNALGVEIDLNGNVIQNYKDLQDEIDKTILKKKAEAILTAEQEAYTEAVNKSSEKQKELTEQEQKLADAEQELADKRQALAEATTPYQKTQAELDYKTQINEVGELRNGIELTKQAIEKYQDVITDYEYETELMATNTTESLNEMVDRNKVALTQDKDNQVESIKTQVETLKEKIERYQSYYDTALEIQDQSNMKMYQSQIEADKDTVEELANTLAEMTSTTEELTPEQVEAWKAIAETSTVAYSNALTQVPESTKQKIEEATGIISTTTSTTIAAQNLGTETAEAFDQSAQMSDSANNMVSSAVTSIVTSSEKLDDAGTTLGESAVDGFESTDFTQSGKDAADDLNSGLSSKKSSFSVTGSLLGGSFASAVMKQISLKASAKTSNADGLAYVPYNGYIARLHEGERVLSKAENEQYMQNHIANNTNNNSVNVNIYAQQVSDADLVRISNFVNRKWGRG